MIVEFIGLPASGKTALANAVYEHLKKIALKKYEI